MTLQDLLNLRRSSFTGVAIFAAKFGPVSGGGGGGKKTSRADDEEETYQSVPPHISTKFQQRSVRYKITIASKMYTCLVPTAAP